MFGKAICYDVDSQCYSAKESIDKLVKDQSMENKFENLCKHEIMRCCPTDLISQNPSTTKFVKQSGKNFKSCPEEITSQCFREKSNPTSYKNCISEKCGKAGYLPATNQYQICKAYLSDDTPDCPDQQCSQMLDISTSTPDLPRSKGNLVLVMVVGILLLILFLFSLLLVF